MVVFEPVWDVWNEQFGQVGAQCGMVETNGTSEMDAV